jgi:hypothetical protein
MFPVQPVADLESYMTSMERKQQNMEKMIHKLQGQATDENCKKLFGYISWTLLSVMYISTLVKLYTIHIL